MFTHTPNPIQKLNSYFSQKINEFGWVKCASERQYIRFLTRKLNEIIPRNSKVWKKEAFLFEFYVSDDILEFYYTIAPGEEHTRKIIKETIENNTTAESFGIDENYFTYSSYEKEFDSSINLRDKDFLDAFLEDFWNNVKIAVSEAERAILTIQDDFSV